MTAIAHANREFASDVSNRLTRTIERICALPGVATPHWCERAAAALLPLARQVDLASTLSPLPQARAGALVCITDGPPSSGAPARAVEAGAAGFDTHALQLLIKRRLTPMFGAGQVVALPPMRHLEQFEVSGRCVRIATIDLDAADADDHTREAAPCKLAWSAVGVQVVVAALVEVDVASASGRLLVEVGAPSALAPAVSLSESAVASSACALARRVAVAFGPSARANGERITQREEEILDFLILGLSVQEIAHKLCRSPHTIHDHVKSLHRKVGASSRGELVARALGSQHNGQAPARRARTSRPAAVQSVK